MKTMRLGMAALFVSAACLVTMVTTVHSFGGAGGPGSGATGGGKPVYNQNQGPNGPSNVGNQPQSVKAQPGSQQGVSGNQGKLATGTAPGTFTCTLANAPGTAKGQKISQNHHIEHFSDGDYWVLNKRKR